MKLRSLSPEVVILAPLAAAIVTSMAVLIGRVFTAHWDVIWSAVTAIISSFALAAFVATAYFGKGLIDETRRIDSVRLANEVLNSEYVAKAFNAINAITATTGILGARPQVEAYCKALRVGGTQFVHDASFENKLTEIIAAWRYISLLYQKGVLDRSIAIEAGYFSVIIAVYIVEPWMEVMGEVGQVTPDVFSYTRDCFMYVRSHPFLAARLPALGSWTPFANSQLWR